MMVSLLEKKSSAPLRLNLLKTPLAAFFWMALASSFRASPLGWTKRSSYLRLFSLMSFLRLAMSSWPWIPISFMTCFLTFFYLITVPSIASWLLLQVKVKLLSLWCAIVPPVHRYAWLGSFQLGVLFVQSWLSRFVQDV